MPATFPGYTAPSDLVIDAGVLRYGSPTYSSATPFGTSRDGFTFDDGRTIRHVPFDGGHAPIQGLSRNTDYQAKLTGKFLTITGPNMMVFNPGSTSDGSTGANAITMKKAGQLFQTGDYGTDLWWIGRQQADGTLFLVHFPVFLVDKYTIVSKHNDEWLIETSILAVLATGSDPQSAPFTQVFAS